MLQTRTPVNRVCRYVRGPLRPLRTHPLVHRLSQSPYPLFQHSTLPYCKFYSSCIKLWSWPGIDPAQPPTIWICGPRAYTLCTFLIKRYCNCGLTSKHHGLQHLQPHRFSPQPSTSLLYPTDVRLAHLATYRDHRGAAVLLALVAPSKRGSRGRWRLKTI